MRYEAIDQGLFIQNRKNLTRLLRPGSLAAVNSNDVLPTNGDGTLPLRQSSDFFYLTGVDQEESILLLYPDAHDETMREILFLRETNESLIIWEGQKLTKEQAPKVSGIARVEWLANFRPIFHRLMCECERVYLNSNEHKRAVIEVQTRDARFVFETMRQYPLHDYQRLAPLMHTLRAVKSPAEIALMRRACGITKDGFERVCRFVKPGVSEMAIEAEFAHEFIRQGGGFAYNPIIASGPNGCVLHYNANDQVCHDGDMLLLDVAACYANYNSDLTRTIPVNGRFTPRQREVYDAVLRVMRGSIAGATPGKIHGHWQKEAEAMMQEELLRLRLLRKSDIKKQRPENPALKKFFMHGVGHLLGLDVHDVGHSTLAFQPGCVLTVEPGIYLPREGFAVRLENNIVVQEDGNVDLMANIPVEAEEIEELMNRKPRRN